ncbi:MAG: universal stress protein [Syntrophales bacterium]|jgi:nucleotide-binding universal stress UspA family protein
MFAPKKILVPTDFSKHSDKALKEAVDIAKKYGSKIYLLHVIDEHIQQCAVDYCIGEEIVRKLQRDSLKASKEKLNRDINTMVDTKKLDIEIDVKEGVPAELILSEQKKKGIDLIVIASHGKTGILKNLIGGVTDKVVRGAKCPVIVVKP